MVDGGIRLARLTPSIVIGYPADGIEGILVVDVLIFSDTSILLLYVFRTLALKTSTSKRSADAAAHLRDPKI